MANLEAWMVAAMLLAGGKVLPASVPAPVAQALQIKDPGAAAAHEAQAKYDSVCATCHGPHGEGSGPAAAGLPVKPRNYHDRSWQSSTSDTEIMTAILQGGPAVGKSPIMPANPDLEDNPAELAALKNLVRSFGK